MTFHKTIQDQQFWKRFIVCTHFQNEKHWTVHVWWMSYHCSGFWPWI